MVKPHARPVTIGVFAGTTDDPYTNSLINGIMDVTRPANARLVCYTYIDFPSEPVFRGRRNAVFQLFDPQTVDGVIVTGTLSHTMAPEALRAVCESFRPLPVVTMAVEVPGFPAVITENQGGMRALMEHLLDGHGYRRLAFIGGPPGQQEAELRKAVFLGEMARRGHEVRPEWLADGDYSYQSGIRAATRLLASGVGDLEGIVSACDTMALGAQEYLEAAGIRIPRDLVLTGFDDFNTYSLTTVRQSVFLQAREAVKTVFTLLEGKSVPDRLTIPASLVVRSSCGCSPMARQEAVFRSPREAGSLPDWQTGLAAAFRAAVRGGEAGTFLGELQRLDEGRETRAGRHWPAVLNRLRADCLPEFARSDRLALAEELLYRGSLLIGEFALDREAQIRFGAQIRGQRLRETSEALVNSTNLCEIMDILARDLPVMGFHGGWLSLFDNPVDPGASASLLLAYDKEGRRELQAGGMSFRPAELRPGGIGDLGPDDCLMIVEVLHSKRDLQGFLLLSANVESSQNRDALRSQISGAIEGAKLWAERERAQKLMVQSEKMAALGSLVAGVAHEINTPVGISLTASSDLRLRAAQAMALYHAGTMSRTQFEQFLEFLEEESRLVETNLIRAGELITSFKRIAVDQTHEEPQLFYLGAYLRDIISSLEPQLKPGGHVVELVCERDRELFGPPGSLTQILGNLVANSVLHGFEGRRGGRITLDCRTVGDRVRIDYADDGAGIRPEHLGRIFEPFFTTKLGQGSGGLGLHIVYNQVTQIWKGSITCRSRPGEGTSFAIEFPLPVPPRA